MECFAPFTTKAIRCHQRCLDKGLFVGFVWGCMFVGKYLLSLSLQFSHPTRNKVKNTSTNIVTENKFPQNIVRFFDSRNGAFQYIWKKNIKPGETNKTIAKKNTGGWESEREKKKTTNKYDVMHTLKREKMWSLKKSASPYAWFSLSLNVSLVVANCT